MKAEYEILAAVLLGMAVVLAIEQFTGLDIRLSDKIYNFSTHQWPIPYSLHLKLNPIFYDGAKHLVAAVGTFCVLYMLYALWKPQYRSRFVCLHQRHLSDVARRALHLTQLYQPVCGDDIDSADSYFGQSHACPFAQAL